MTTYQLSLLRFWRMKREFPQLNHAGNEPGPTFEDVGKDWTMRMAWDSARKQRAFALREFERGCE